MVITFVISEFVGLTKFSLGTNVSGGVHLVTVCWVIIIAYTCTYSIMAWCIFNSSISFVALYASARPLFTVIIVLIQGKLSFQQLFNIVFLIITFAGLFITTLSKKFEKKQKKREVIDNCRRQVENHFRRTFSKSSDADASDITKSQYYFETYK